mmetsp:Transcript_28824/g.51501  ORF Transcript_28824/g.51501 Transcript_28824/m.51501 type:complete len:298 (+) Transcript_28824:650-1543(+)
MVDGVPLPSARSRELRQPQGKLIGGGVVARLRPGVLPRHEAVCAAGRDRGAHIRGATDLTGQCQRCSGKALGCRDGKGGARDPEGLQLGRAEVRRWPAGYELSVGDHRQEIGSVHKLDLVRDQDARLVPQQSALRAQAIVHEVLRDMHVNGRKWIIQHVEASGAVLVGCPGQTDASLLAAGQVDPSLADDGGSSIPQLLEVCFKGTGLDHLRKALFVEGFAEEDVVCHRAVEDPWDLRAVGDGLSNLYDTRSLRHFVQECRNQGAFPDTHGADYHQQLASRDDQLRHSKSGLVQPGK